MDQNDRKTIGLLDETEEKRKELALKSLHHCSKDKQFGKLFPDIKNEIDEKLKELQESRRQKSRRRSETQQETPFKKIKL